MSKSLNMNGPHSLNTQSVNTNVNKKMGNYALGYVNDQDTFIVQYVGRSDTDIHGRLTYWANQNESKNFKYSYAKSTKEAFEKECKNYHDFNPPKNDMHPDAPSGTSYTCPYC